MVFYPTHSPTPPYICGFGFGGAALNCSCNGNILPILTPGQQLRRKVLGMVLVVMLTWLVTQEWGSGMVADTLP